MKTKMRAALIPIAIVLFASGCMTQKVKDATLLPAIQLSSDSVHRLADKGVESYPLLSQVGVQDTIDSFFIQIETGESGKIVVAYQTQWGTVKESANKGVGLMLEDGSIGEFVSRSLTEEINNFDTSLANYAE